MPSTSGLSSAQSATHTPSVPLSREANIARLLLFIEGVGITAWAPLVPLLQTRVGLSEGLLGALLLGLGIGAAVAMMAVGKVYARLGCRATILGAVVLLCAPLPILASASGLPLIIAALLVFGLGIGALDGAANIWAVSVDQRSERALMPGFHGCFSVGGVLSPTVVTLLLGAGVNAALAAASIGLLCVIGALYCAPTLPRAATVRSAAQSLAMPKGVVILLGLIFLVVMLAEAVMRDWSGVFLTTQRGVSADIAGFGYVAFASTMMLFRFLGDAIVRRLGLYWVVAGGGLCAALGIATVLLTPSWQMALFGFALVGVGCSNIVPMVFTAAGQQHAMPVSTAIPAVATVGYLGILGGPAVIGLIAEYSTLSIALGALGGLLALIMFGARVMKP